MAGKYRTAVLIYLLFFAVALGVFLTGHPRIAFAIIFFAWAILALWIRFGRQR
jgi:hypothetical protein